MSRETIDGTNHESFDNTKKIKITLNFISGVRRVFDYKEEWNEEGFLPSGIFDGFEGEDGLKKNIQNILIENVQEKDIGLISKDIFVEDFDECGDCITIKNFDINLDIVDYFTKKFKVLCFENGKISPTTIKYDSDEFRYHHRAIVLDNVELNTKTFKELNEFISEISPNGEFAYNNITLTDSKILSPFMRLFSRDLSFLKSLAITHLRLCSKETKSLKF